MAKPRYPRTNKNVYPTTAQLEEYLSVHEREEPTNSYTLMRLSEIAVEYLGEYEHGSADIEDLFMDLTLSTRKGRLEVVRQVLQDFLGTVAFSDENQS
jgi:hypothetical protein